ncbi:MAG: CRISPR-associated endonuclease Cas2 [Bacteroidetes bacterium]|nr:CRISPR-associated endonuclease Cas2 [Bacteroidota bacterium]
MKYLIMYDLQNNRQSRAINKLLGSLGNRVQNSVYECDLRFREYDDMLVELQKIVAEGGNVRIYALCRECMKKGVGVGDFYVNPANDGCVVI